MTEKILYRDGYKYQLAKTYSTMVGVKPHVDALVGGFVWLKTDGFLTIKEGYAWDGPSGPTADTPDSLRGSLVHDALYQLMREGGLDGKWREQADKELRRICLEDGMLPARAAVWYDAVRLFAGGAASPKNAKPVLEAPRDA